MKFEMFDVVCKKCGSEAMCLITNTLVRVTCPKCEKTEETVWNKGE
jgi:Zn finger protein HypA/HybF involved in hydrogenase expression